MDGQKVIVEILSAQLHEIEHLLVDHSITEIMVTADGEVWIERSGVIACAGINLQEDKRWLALRAVAGYVKQDLNEMNPIISTSINGMRFAGAAKPVEQRGTTLCIRKHQPPESRPSLEQLVHMRALTQKQADYLVEQIVVQKKSCAIAGPTSSGKTTLANALIAKFPSYERIGIIEDASELCPRVANHDAYLTNERTGVDARTLIKHAMRSRYDRLLLGETRGTDTYDLIRALSSGHNGSMTTLHANSAREALSTIEMLYQMSLPNNAQIDVAVSRRYIASAIGMVVFAERIYEPQENGDAKSVRRVGEIAILKGIKNEDYDLEYFE